MGIKVGSQTIDGEGGGTVTIADITDAGATGAALLATTTAAASRSALALPPTVALPSTPLLHLRADLGVTSSASLVSAWASQGSLAASASQSTAGMRPLIVPAYPGGPLVVRFDGSDDFLEIPWAAGFDAATSLTLIVVCRALESVNSVIIERSYDAAHGAPYQEWALFVDAATTSVNMRSLTDSVSTTTNANGIGQAGYQFRELTMYTYTLTAGAGGRVLRRNGVPFYSGTPTATPTYTNNVSIRLGADSVGGECLFGEIGEVALWPSVLSAGDLAQAEASIGARWAKGLWLP